MTIKATKMISPILLCGGSGTRLWPLSRKSYPKQFATFFGDMSLFQATAKRFSGDGFTKPTVLTNSDFRFIVAEQLMEKHIDPGVILLEPQTKNTAPAILASALLQAEQNPNSLMLVAPTDHVVPDQEAFLSAIEIGSDAARAGNLVTFGIEPTHAETGYGYLELAQDASRDHKRAHKLQRFVEKPDAALAETMIESGRFLWNAGIFLFSCETVINAFEQHAPHLIDPVTEAVAKRQVDLGFVRLDQEAWAKADDVSIDYAVMERADNLVVAPFAAGWSDLGGWDAIWRESDHDATSVALSGPVTAIDCTNSLLRSQDDSLELVGIGLENVVAVAMPDAVLVADLSRSQDVRKAVKRLKDKQIRQAEEFPRDHRPWGWFESLVIGKTFQVKRIVVKPGASLSLQSHHHRSEHWIVVEGNAKVTIGEKKQLLMKNQSTYIPAGTRHRLENPGTDPMVLIEVQTGSYLGEDDIIRHEDRYKRA